MYEGKNWRLTWRGLKQIHYQITLIELISINKVLFYYLHDMKVFFFSSTSSSSQDQSKIISNLPTYKNKQNVAAVSSRLHKMKNIHSERFLCYKKMEILKIFPRISSSINLLFLKSDLLLTKIAFCTFDFVVFTISRFTFSMIPSRPRADYAKFRCPNSCALLKKSLNFMKRICSSKNPEKP